jgi:hypothetical protein
VANILDYDFKDAIIDYVTKIAPDIALMVAISIATE